MKLNCLPYQVVATHRRLQSQRQTAVYESADVLLMATAILFQHYNCGLRRLITIVWLFFFFFFLLLSILCSHCGRTRWQQQTGRPKQTVKLDYLFKQLVVLFLLFLSSTCSVVSRSVTAVFGDCVLSATEKKDRAAQPLFPPPPWLSAHLRVHTCTFLWRSLFCYFELFKLLVGCLGSWSALFFCVLFFLFVWVFWHLAVLLEKRRRGEREINLSFCFLVNFPLFFCCPFQSQWCLFFHWNQTAFLHFADPQHLFVPSPLQWTVLNAIAVVVVVYCKLKVLVHVLFML